MSFQIMTICNFGLEFGHESATNGDFKWPDIISLVTKNIRKKKEKRTGIKKTDVLMLWSANGMADALAKQGMNHSSPFYVFSI